MAEAPVQSLGARLASVMTHLLYLQQLQKTCKLQAAGCQQQATARLGPTIAVLSFACPRDWYIRLLNTRMKYTKLWVLRLL